MTFTMNRSYVLAAVLVALGAAQGCTSTSTPEINPPPPVPPLARPVSFLITDSATRAPVAIPVTVTIRDSAGALSTVTQDRAGTATSAFVTNGGVAVFQIASTATLPQTLVAVVSATGYSTMSQNFTVATAAGVEASATILKIAAPPAGTVAVAASAGSSNPGGTTGAAVTVTTSPEPESNALAEVTIPATTTITTKDGAPLSGALTATVVYYNPTASTSLAGFPSGFSVNIPSQGGQGSFLTVGFNSVQVTDANGRAAANFDKPIAIRQVIPAGTKNPTNDTVIAVGDSIPFWSYDTASGKWQAEPPLTAQSVASILYATGFVTHLSYFNLGWFQPQVFCQLTPTLTIAGNAAGRPIDIWMITAGYENTIATGLTASSMKLTDFPSGVKGFLYAYYQGRQVGTLAFTNLCGAAVGPLTVTVPPLPPASLAVTVQKACVEDATKTTPIGSAYVSAWASLLLGGVPEMVASGLTNASGVASLTNLPYNTSIEVRFSTGQPGITFPNQTVTLTSGQAGTMTATTSVTCQQTGATGG